MQAERNWPLSLLDRRCLMLDQAMLRLLFCEFAGFADGGELLSCGRPREFLGWFES